MREAMARVCRGDRVMERLLPVFDRTGVETRYLVRPLDWYASGQTFEARNGVFAECGLDLAERAARTCLETSGVAADQIDQVFFVTTTGLATPSLDARVAARLGLRADIRRLPLFGLGLRRRRRGVDSRPRIRYAPIPISGHSSCRSSCAASSSPRRPGRRPI